MIILKDNKSLSIYLRYKVHIFLDNNKINKYIIRNSLLIYNGT